MRRRDALAAQPNPGHIAIAEIEQKLIDRLYLCTQNVDDLHGRRVPTTSITCTEHSSNRDAGTAARPSPDKALYESAIMLPTCQKCGALVRPHIVWFGEGPFDMEGIYRELYCATILLVVGTSGAVYPAAGFVQVANQRSIRTIYIGPEKPLNADAFDEIILGSATPGPADTHLVGSLGLTIGVQKIVNEPFVQSKHNDSESPNPSPGYRTSD